MKTGNNDASVRLQRLLRALRGIALGLGTVTMAASAAFAAPASDSGESAVHGAGKYSKRVYRGATATLPATPVQFKGDLRHLPSVRAWRPGDAIKEIPKLGRAVPSKIDPAAQAAARARVGSGDPLLGKQHEASAAARTSHSFTTPVLNFQAQTYTGVSPPDTVGDVGPNYYIQAINAGGGANIAIYNKLDGSLATPIFALDSLGTGACADGLGDPIVLYDQLAGRWLLSEFSNSSNDLCVYVSMTGDPISGGWYAYSFLAPNFPDYPKYGVWPDAYYVSSNEPSAPAYAFDRNAMLAGAPATRQRFETPELGAFGFQALQPADSDGAVPPPAGSPGLFIRHRDDEAHSPGSAVAGTDFLELWEFDVDWDVPANSTFTGPTNIPIAEIDSELCGFLSFNCFPQAGSGTTLDPLREVVMFRLVHRNFGDHEALVGNLVTDVSGTDRGGIRWFELRRATPGAGAWSLHQEGTHAPADAHSRWMGSIAMDGRGNMALGYSTSGFSLFPAMRYTGRLAADPPGTMPQGEHQLAGDLGASTSNRWGDYSAMSIDPSDDCTFWHTNMYSVPGGSWTTQIASFRFDDCGDPGFSLVPSTTVPKVCAPGSADPVTISVGSTLGFTNPVSMSLTAPAGITGSYSVNPVVPGGSTALTLSADGTVPAGNHDVTISGSAADADDRDITITVGVTDGAPVPVNLMTPADGSAVMNTAPTLSWAPIPGASSYDVEIATDAAFTDLVFSTSTTSASTSSAAAGLSGETVYYWRVRASNICGAGEFSAPFAFTIGTVFCGVGPITIPDNSGFGPGSVNLDTVVSSGAVITDLRVSVDATHSWVGDLVLTLTHIDTVTSVVLMDRPGYPDLFFGCDNPNVDAVFTDSSATPVENACGVDPAIAGMLQPEQPLAAFDGQSIAGTWRLNVTDNASGDTGSLNIWCLVPTLDTDGDGVADDVDNCTNVFNPGQQDSNGDLIGNACDPDVVGTDCRVNFPDLAAYRAGFGSSNPDLDLVGPGSGPPDGIVNFADIAVLKSMYFGMPGPSAAGCN